MNLRTCTQCKTTMIPASNAIAFWFTFILGFFFLWPLWILTWWLHETRNKCTACGCKTTYPAQTKRRLAPEPDPDDVVARVNAEDLRRFKGDS